MTIDKSAPKALAEKCLADQISIDSDFHDELSSGILALLADLDEAENGMKHSCAIRLKKEIERLQAENESLKRERTDWQAECLKKGFEYIREPDAHYVLADVPEMAELLGQLLGVEVRSKDNDDYGETVSSLNEQLEACNSVYGRAYDLEKEVEELKAKLDKAIEFQPIGEACLTNRDELRASLGLNRGDNLHEHVEMLRKDAELYQQVQIAAGSLPPGWEIALRIENGYGGVDLIDPYGTVVDLDSVDESLSESVASAVAFAMSKESPR